MSKIKKPKIFSNKDDILDNRQFVFGEIWKIRDILIGIPDADRLDQRSEHFTRCVVIIDNNNSNNEPDFPVITVAPMSSRTDCVRDFDVELFKGKDGVEEDCILRLSLCQPVLKKDLYQCVGNLSEDAKESL